MRDATELWRATTQANLAAARKTHGRLGSKKSRSGCVTCKIRRVKCDEGRPACHRCASTGRKCDGYGTKQQQQQQQQSLSVTANDVVAWSTPQKAISALKLGGPEKQCFDYFLTWASPRIGGAFDKPFWGGVVLQLCHAEPFVLDAVLSISILDRHPQYLQHFTNKRANRRDSVASDGEDAFKAGEAFACLKPDINHVTALKYYNRSIARLKERMTTGAISLPLALLSCLLFFTIEVIRDSAFAAFHLFGQGIMLIRNTDHEYGHDPLVGMMKSMLARLAVLVAGFGHPLLLDMPKDFLDFCGTPVFVSLSEARTSLYALMAESHAFVKDAAARHAALFRRGVDGDDDIGSLAGLGSPLLPLAVEIIVPGEGFSPRQIGSRCDESGGPLDEAIARVSKSEEHMLELQQPSSPPIMTTASLLAREQDLQCKLAQWYDAFASLRSSLPHAEPEAVSTLMMYYHVSIVWLSTRLQLAETAFDGYRFHFEQILQHAEDYIQAKQAEQVNFTSEVGAISPLYFVASKCRIPTLRRKALHMMSRTPKKEGVWGASTTTELATLLIEIEEEGLGLPSPSFPLSAMESDACDAVRPAESRRVHNISVASNDALFRHDLIVTRYDTGADGSCWKTEDAFPIGGQLEDRVMVSRIQSKAKSKLW